jgi:hypothetical protein
MEWAVAAIDAHSLPQRPHPLSKILARLALFGLLLSVTAVLAFAGPPVSCKRKTDTSNLFPVLGIPIEFKIESIGCRAAWPKNSPTLRIVLNNPPAVSIEWENR